MHFGQILIPTELVFIDIYPDFIIRIAIYFHKQIPECHLVIHRIFSETNRLLSINFLMVITNWLGFTGFIK